MALRPQAPLLVLGLWGLGLRAQAPLLVLRFWGLGLRAQTPLLVAHVQLAGLPPPWMALGLTAMGSRLGNPGSCGLLVRRVLERAMPDFGSSPLLNGMRIVLPIDRRAGQATGRLDRGADQKWWHLAWARL